MDLCLVSDAAENLWQLFHVLVPGDCESEIASSIGRLDFCTPFCTDIASIALPSAAMSDCEVINWLETLDYCLFKIDVGS